MNEDNKLKIADMMMALIFEESLEAGKPIKEMMDEATKGEEHNKQIAKQIKALTGKKPNDAYIELSRLRAKLHMLNVMIQDNAFNVSEDRRYEYANYLIELANELKTIKGDCNE